MITLTPAYGKDYQSESEAVKAYTEGRDFVMRHEGHRYNGGYCSIRDLNFCAVEIRFCCGQKVVVFDPKNKLN